MRMEKGESIFFQRVCVSVGQACESRSVPAPSSVGSAGGSRVASEDGEGVAPLYGDGNGRRESIFLQHEDQCFSTYNEDQCFSTYPGVCTGVESKVVFLVLRGR